MTRVRNDSDRTRVLENLTVTLARIRAYRHGITDLRDAISLRLKDGLKATDYTSGTRGGDDGWTPVERAALLRSGDQAHDDLHTLDCALAALAEADDALVLLGSRYPLWNGGPKKQKPGKGVSPVGRCEVCWAYGRDEMTSERYRRYCDWCGRFKADHGQKAPVQIWRLCVEQGKARYTTADLRKHALHLLPKDQAS